ncbi:MAG: hypothetical protein VB081_11210 [Christensenella sp.]|uniref:hypothetical protein n=1 Tax=Christensenella sp. TaxID=1935934 RepID=UPI002B21D41E|nr:hypothetical protein [Christensenella sp.]MEA5004056.1 hypothetical protein [Christensenella sp.]
MKKHVKILYLCLAFSFALGIVPFYGLAQDAGQPLSSPSIEIEQTETAIPVSTESSIPAEPPSGASPFPSASVEPSSSVLPASEPLPEASQSSEPSAIASPQATVDDSIVPIVLPTEQSVTPLEETPPTAPTLLDISQASIEITQTGATGVNTEGISIAETALNPFGYIITGSTGNHQVIIRATSSVTLQNANISPDVSQNTYAMQIADGASVSVTLEGSNTLKSGDAYAGLDVDAATVTIGGSGSLKASGGEGHYVSNGDMSIQSGSGGAGIGGRGTSTVNITGGTIYAYGQRGGAGIGGNGAPANNGGATTGCGAGTVNISGGMIYANGGDGASPGAWGGSSGGAGIGSGYNGSKAGNQITLTGGHISASGGGRSDAIGGGSVSITNADILAYAGSEASAIFGNLSIAASASIEGYSDGTKFPVFDQNTSEGSAVLAPMLNIILKERTSLAALLNVVLTPDTGNAVSLTMPAGAKGFVKTVNSGTWKISAGNVAQAPQADPYSNLFTTNYARITTVPYVDPLTLKDVVFVRDDGSDANDGSTAQTAFQTLEKAYVALKPGGTIVVCGKMNISVFAWSLNKVFTKPSTVTSVYAGVDYKQTNDAQFWGTGSPIMMSADTTFQNIYLNNGNCGYYANGYHLTMGAGVTTGFTTSPWGDLYPSVYGGCHSDFSANANQSGVAVINVAGGTFSYAAGGYYIEKGGEQLFVTGTDTVINNLWAFDKITVGSNTIPAYFKITEGGIDPAGVKDIEVKDGSTIEFTAPVLSDTSAPITRNLIGGGTLKLPSGSVLEIPGMVSNTTTLNLSGYATLAPGTFVASADKDSTGTFVLPDNTERKLEKKIENDKAVWRIVQGGPTPTPSPTPTSSPTTSPSPTPTSTTSGTPSPTASSTPIPTPTSAPNPNAGEIIVDIDIPSVPGGSVNIEVPVESVINAIASGSKSVCTDIHVPHDMTQHIASIRVPQAIFEAARQNNTEVCFRIFDTQTQKLLYRWDFMEITQAASDVDVALDIEPIEKVPDIDPALAPGSLVISTRHEGTLPGMAMLTLYVGDKYKPGDILNFYYYDNGTLDPVSAGLVVDVEGHVRVSLSHCCKYVLQSEQKTAAAGVKTSVGSNDNTAPKTSDTKPLLPFVLLGVISAVTICVAGHHRKKSQR